AGADMNEHFCNTGTTDLNNFLTVNNPGTWTSLDGFPNSVFDPTTGVFTMDNLAKDTYTFQYVVTNDSPCDNDTSLAFIEITEIANIDFTSNLLEGCSPLTVDFTDITQVNGTTNFTWFVDGIQVGTNQNMTYTFDEVRCYDIDLTIETDNFCSATLTNPNMICVNPDPIADFDFSPATIYSDDPTVDFNNKSQLNAINQWDFDGLGVSSQANPSFTFPLGIEDTYEVLLVVYSDKGCVDSIIKEVPVVDQTIFYVPNAFTPDGNDVNNTFLPVMTVGVDPQNYKLEIFNRWGEVIFESNDYNVGWDGTYGGKIVKSGTYLWKIRFNEIKTEDDIIRMGTVVLMR
uniref:T9SS type B sorting domain-containing protein n=1 Tax=Brumimicrobium mesophilum TaxID=392717 RepID=UPI00131DA3FE